MNVQSLLLYFAVGFAEWLLYGWRLKASQRGLGLLAGGLAAAEVALGLWVFRAYSAGADLAGVSYAAGVCLGTWIGVQQKKREPEALTLGLPRYLTRLPSGHNARLWAAYSRRPRSSPAACPRSSAGTP